MKMLIALFALLTALTANAAPACKEGYVNLRLSGDEQSGYIRGFFGDTYVSWNVSSGRVYAMIDMEMAFLDVRQDGNDYTLSGWMWNRFVNWRSFGDSFSFWNYCFKRQ